MICVFINRLLNQNRDYRLCSQGINYKLKIYAFMQLNFEWEVGGLQMEFKS